MGGEGEALPAGMVSFKREGQEMAPAEPLPDIGAKISTRGFNLFSYHYREMEGIT